MAPLSRLAARLRPRESCYAADHLPPGPAPDRRVFGIPAPAEVPDTLAVARRRCAACDVEWTGAAACWCCGQAVTA